MPDGGRDLETRSHGVTRRLLVALQFLTRLPTPAIEHVEAADLSRSAVFFPLVGGIVGICVILGIQTGNMLESSVAGLAGLVAWVAVTGALHLDGLGDVADGFGAAHRDPQRFREVLRDPHAGNFAITAIAVQIAAKLVLLTALAPAQAASLCALLLVPAWARWGAMVWARTLPPLWSGTASSFAPEIGWRAIVVWAVALALASAWAAPGLLVAVIIVPAIGVFWRRRLGGISGDGLGASIEVTETLLLVALLAHTP